MRKTRWDDDETFEAVVTPSRSTLDHLIDTSRSLADERGRLPDADSRGMRERAAGLRFAADQPWGSDPASWPQELANVILFGGEDQAKTMIHALQHRTTPVYGHIVLARSAIEHAAKAYWLLDPRASVKLRIARGMNERLHTLAETIRLPLPADEHRKARQRRAEIWERAKPLGFQKVSANGKPYRERKGKPDGPWTLDEPRPPQTVLVKKLFGTKGDRELGAILYSYFSAVAHGNIFGLSQSLSRELPHDAGALSESEAAVYTSSDAVVTVLSGVALGLANAYERRNEFFGWNSDAFSDAYAEALSIGVRKLQDIRA
jgi:hypothetical protein